MKQVKFTEKFGVVAEYNGKYWGKTYEDGHSTVYEFTDINNAHISDPEYCHIPTDMTYGAHSPHHKELLKAALKKIKVITIYEVEE